MSNSRKDPEPPKKSGIINCRISAELRRRLDVINTKYKVKDTDMVEDALTALADLVEAAEKYESPVRMLHAKDYPKFESFFHLNEAEKGIAIVEKHRQLSDPSRALYRQQRKNA